MMPTSVAIDVAELRRACVRLPDALADAGESGSDLERLLGIWSVWRPALRSGGGL
ncbi:MAG: hypothetical protein ACFCVE_15415 [Phycisphaerae bacterium]